MYRLLSHANEAGAKVIIVHDKEQLSAIDRGAPSRALAERFGEMALTDVVRQNHPEMKKATYEFGTGQPGKAVARYEALGAINCSAIDENVARKLMIEAWATDRLEGKSQIMMAFTNDSVKALNDAARQVRISAGEIGQGENYSVSKGQRAFAVGDRVYFLKNDKNLGVKNGTLGTIEEINKNQFNVKLDGEEKAKVCFNIGQYDHIDHGYAGTVHKEQGVTVDKAYVLISKYFDRHLAYVAFTRHRDSLMVFSNQQDFKDRDTMYKTLCRERSKGMAVDFAQARWIEPSNKHELNLSMYAVPQQQLAKDRLAIKALKGKMPDRDFSFARALEQFKGTIQGIVRLSDDRQMLRIGKEDQSKLVAISHDFENHVGKKVSIEINNQGKILQCMVEGQGKMISSNEKQKENFVSERSQAQKLPQREIEIGLG